LIVKTLFFGANQKLGIENCIPIKNYLFELSTRRKRSVFFGDVPLPQFITLADYFFSLNINYLCINEAIWVKTFLLVRRFAFKNSELARHEKNQKNRCLFAWLFFGNGCFCPALPR
jgi:hypothetical protein